MVSKEFINILINAKNILFHIGWNLLVITKFVSPMFYLMIISFDFVVFHKFESIKECVLEGEKMCQRECF